MIAATDAEIKALRAAGKILAGVLREAQALAKEGISTAELDLFAEHAMRARGAVPSFLNYKPEGAAYPYPASLCISLNEEVVHGIPSEKRILRNGDVVKLDAGLSYNGYFVDSARTFVVGGSPDSAANKLIDGTKEALRAAIAVAKPGARVGDIGAAISRVAANHQLGVVEDLGGHATGRAVHEQPFIANDGKAGEGEEIVEGMVLAIEPMLAEGHGAIVVEKDEWTLSMADNKRAAHFEDTVLITKEGAEILTA